MNKLPKMLESIKTSAVIAFLVSVIWFIWSLDVRLGVIVIKIWITGYIIVFGFLLIMGFEKPSVKKYAEGQAMVLFNPKFTMAQKLEMLKESILKTLNTLASSEELHEILSSAQEIKDEINSDN